MPDTNTELDTKDELPDDQKEEGQDESSEAPAKEPQEEDPLKKIKENLNRVYKERDELLTNNKELEKKAREEELKRLREAGKLTEALETELKNERAIRETLEQRVTELSRDNEVRAALAGQPFRNDKALKTAQNEIISDLNRDESGQWVHKSGKSIDEAVRDYIADEQNSFLLKPKVSSGAGSGGPSKSPDDESNKSLYKLSQEKVLELVAQGKLPKKS
jgi:hypothetical protein